MPLAQTFTKWLIKTLVLVMTTKEQLAIERKTSAQHKKERETFNSVEWPSHVAFMDTTEEWELRMSKSRAALDRRF